MNNPIGRQDTRQVEHEYIIPLWETKNKYTRLNIKSSFNSIKIHLNIILTHSHKTQFNKSILNHAIYLIENSYEETKQGYMSLTLTS